MDNHEDSLEIYRKIHKDIKRITESETYLEAQKLLENPIFLAQSKAVNNISNYSSLISSQEKVFNKEVLESIELTRKSISFINQLNISFSQFQNMNEHFEKWNKILQKISNNSFLNNAIPSYVTPQIEEILQNINSVIPKEGYSDMEVFINIRNPAEIKDRKQNKFIKWAHALLIVHEILSGYIVPSIFQHQAKIDQMELIDTQQRKIELQEQTNNLLQENNEKLEYLISNEQKQLESINKLNHVLNENQKSSDSVLSQKQSEKLIEDVDNLLKIMNEHVDSSDN